MSTELYFILPNADLVAKARDYFVSRTNCTVKGDQAEYNNEDTGCGFTIDFDETEPEIPAADDNLSPAIVFNINYARPRPFLAEAVKEISDYNAAFPGKFFNEVTGEVENFNPVDFARSWQVVNDSFVRTLAEEDQTIAYAPAAQIAAVWAWNSKRASIQEAEGSNVFVPKLLFHIGPAHSTPTPIIVWPYPDPVLFPRLAVSAMVVTPAKEKRSFLSRLLGSKQQDEADFRLLKFEELSKAAQFVEVQVEGIACYRYRGSVTPAIDALLATAKPLAQAAAALVHPSMVLEQEILQD